MAGLYQDLCNFMDVGRVFVLWSPT